MWNAVLPYPVKASVNSVWKRSKTGVFLSGAAKEYRKEVFYALRSHEKFGKQKVSMYINMYPPDNRKRDIDNILKTVLDALQYAQIFDNDNQVVVLRIEKFSKIANGALDVIIECVP